MYVLWVMIDSFPLLPSSSFSSCFLLLLPPPASSPLLLFPSLPSSSFSLPSPPPPSPSSSSLPSFPLSLLPLLLPFSPPSSSSSPSLSFPPRPLSLSLSSSPPHSLLCVGNQLVICTQSGQLHRIGWDGRIEKSSVFTLFEVPVANDMLPESRGLGATTGVCSFVRV